MLLSPKLKTKSSLKFGLELISSKMYFKPVESFDEYTDNSNSVESDDTLSILTSFVIFSKKLYTI